MVSPLNEVLATAGFTADEIRQVHSGNLLEGVVESTSDRELALKFAFLVSMPAKQAQEVFMVSGLKQASDPSVTELVQFHHDDLKDFDKLSLHSDPIVKAYLKAGPGTDLNLSQEEIKKFQALKRTDPTRQGVETCLKQVLLERYLSYRKSGLAGIAPYARSGGKNYSPGDELRHKTEMSSGAKKEVPSFHRYMVEYPKGPRPENLQESFSWVNTNVDDTPTISLVHKMGLLEGDVFVFCQRYFYVSRSHNSVQGIGGAFPVEGGKVVVTFVQRTSTDKVTGFGGSAKRSLGARIMGTKMAENFERLRQVQEQYNKEEEAKK